MIFFMNNSWLFGIEQKKWEAEIRETGKGKGKKWVAEIKVGGETSVSRQFNKKRMANQWMKITMEHCQEEAARLQEEEKARKGRQEEMQKQKDNKNKTKKKRPPADRPEKEARKKNRTVTKVTITAEVTI